MLAGRKPSEAMGHPQLFFPSLATSQECLAEHDEPNHLVYLAYT